MSKAYYVETVFIQHAIFCQYLYCLQVYTYILGLKFLLEKQYNRVISTCVVLTSNKKHFILHIFLFQTLM